MEYKIIKKTKNKVPLLVNGAGWRMRGNRRLWITCMAKYVHTGYTNGFFATLETCSTLTIETYYVRTIIFVRAALCSPVYISLHVILQVKTKIATFDWFVLSRLLWCPFVFRRCFLTLTLPRALLRLAFSFSCAAGGDPRPQDSFCEGQAADAGCWW